MTTMTKAQLEVFAIFCRVRKFRQTAKGLRHAYKMLTETGDSTWLLIAFDCAAADARKRASKTN